MRPEDGTAQGKGRENTMKRAQRQDLLTGVLEQMLQAFGPQHWWPAETPFEVIIGAILTQNTAWKNVEKAIAALRERDLLALAPLLQLPQAELAGLIRASGYYNQKAQRLKHFCEHVGNHWAGNLDGFLQQDMASLREQLLRMRGIGPETADSIVLYAAEQPSFVVDTYTYRIFSRHGWVPEETGYEELRSFFMDNLPADVNLFKEYHALLVRTGHYYCRRRPVCGGCPLEPHQGTLLRGER
jgi:endonuclease III related protein